MASLELGRMHKEYGKEYGKECGSCCNYRSVGGGCCIAYGEKYCSGWPEDALACNLYNRPFLAIRPKRNELGLYFELHKRKAAEEKIERQLTLF